MRRLLSFLLILLLALAAAAAAGWWWTTQPLVLAADKVEVSVPNGASLRTAATRAVDGGVRTWPELLPLIQAGRIDTSGIFTHTMSLDDADAGYAAVAARSADCVKVTLTV